MLNKNDLKIAEFIGDDEIVPKNSLVVVKRMPVKDKSQSLVFRLRGNVRNGVSGATV